MITLKDIYNLIIDSEIKHIPYVIETYEKITNEKLCIDKSTNRMIFSNPIISNYSLYKDKILFEKQVILMISQVFYDQFHVDEYPIEIDNEIGMALPNMKNTFIEIEIANKMRELFDDVSHILDMIKSNYDLSKDYNKLYNLLKINIIKILSENRSSIEDKIDSQGSMIHPQMNWSVIYSQMEQINKLIKG